MANLTEASSRLGRVLAIFPGQTQELLQLALRDPAFRGLCDDLADARASMNRLANLSGSTERPEVEEYRKIIGELEDEIRAYVASRSP